MINEENPEIYAEMHLVFDNDFDVNMITKFIGIEPSVCMNRKQTTINPLTKQNNVAFWTIRSKSFNEYDAKYAIEDLVLSIECKISLIKEICEKNNGNVIFTIVPLFYYQNKPAIYFERNFLKIVNELNAEIEVDMYVI